MALTRCKECGKEISKDAEVCPNCGKKQEHLSNQIGQVIRAVITLYLLYLLYDFCAEIVNYANYTESSVQSENITYQKISLEDLQEQLEENAARAQQMYKGKYIEFQGRLDVIDANGKYFTIDTGNIIISGNHCRVKNEQQKQVLISKNKGDVVFVKGKIRDVGEIAGYYIDVTELR